MPETRPQAAGVDSDARRDSARTRGVSLPRTARLLAADAFERVFASPTRCSDRYFTMLARKHEVAGGEPGKRAARGGARLGLAISKRCALRAVARNRIKRVIRESFRHAQCDLPDVDVVVMCRRAAAGADKQTLRASLDALWKRIGR